MATGIHSRGKLTISVLQGRLRQLRDPAFRAELAQVLAETAGKLVADGFRRGLDPYGKPWAPLKRKRTRDKRGTRGRPLLDTWRLRASFAAVPRPGGFSIEATAVYAPHHQYGTRRGVPQRQMVPMPETGGLPASWRSVFDRDTRALVRRKAEGK
jgi:phage gpG-like protein